MNHLDPTGFQLGDTFFHKSEGHFTPIFLLDEKNITQGLSRALVVQGIVDEENPVTDESTFSASLFVGWVYLSNRKGRGAWFPTGITVTPRGDIL